MIRHQSHHDKASSSRCRTSNAPLAGRKRHFQALVQQNLRTNFLAKNRNKSYKWQTGLRNQPTFCEAFIHAPPWFAQMTSRCLTTHFIVRALNHTMPFWNTKLESAIIIKRKKQIFATAASCCLRKSASFITMSVMFWFSRSNACLSERHTYSKMEWKITT